MFDLIEKFSLETRRVLFAVLGDMLAPGEMTTLQIVLLSVASAIAGNAQTEPNTIESNQEQWSLDCVPIARAALRVAGDIKAPVLLSRNEPVTGQDFSEFGLKCPGLLPIFEIVVDATGGVRCVRIIHLGKSKPPSKLSRTIHERMQKWKFKPATLHGKSVAVLYDITMNYRCR